LAGFVSELIGLDLCLDGFVSCLGYFDLCLNGYDLCKKDCDFGIGFIFQLAKYFFYICFMQFSDILGQDYIKNHLVTSALSGRIPHAQLFIGPEGCGTLAMAVAYAQFVLCNNTGAENTGGNESCNLKFLGLSHPDLHFVYPNVANEDVKTKPKSADFIMDWREFVLEKPYGSLFDWYKHLGVQNKQGEIRVDDAQDILKSLALKSYEGGYKVMIVWMADKMNIAASNKLLKLLEEPPEKTLFILISENEEVSKEEEPKTETKIVEYKVKKGDNLGSIAHKYNVAVAEIKEWNEMEDNNVKLGASLIVSKKEVAVNEIKSSKKESLASNDRDEVKLYYVKKGDSLFSIAKKYPGVTISDIKKWNGIKNESLKPGMKLKINNG
jgi:LysM repeat protein